MLRRPPQSAAPPIKVMVKDFPDDDHIVLRTYSAEPTQGLRRLQQNPHEFEFICPFHSFNAGKCGCDRFDTCRLIHLNNASHTLFEATNDRKYKDPFFVLQRVKDPPLQRRGAAVPAASTTTAVTATPAVSFVAAAKKNRNADYDDDDDEVINPNTNHQVSSNKNKNSNNSKNKPVGASVGAVATGNNNKPPIKVLIKDFLNDAPIVLTDYKAAETKGLRNLISGKRPAEIVCPYFSFNGNPDGCKKNQDCGYIHLEDASSTLFKATKDKKFKGSFYVRDSPPVVRTQNNNNDDDDDDDYDSPQYTSTSNLKNQSNPSVVSSSPRRPNRPANFVPYEPARRAQAYAQTFGDAPKKQELTYEVGLDPYHPPVDKFDANTFPRTKSEAMDPKYRHAADLPQVRNNLLGAGALLLTAEKFAVLPQNQLHPTTAQLSRLRPATYRYLLHMRQWTDEIRSQIDLLQFSQENIRAPHDIVDGPRTDRRDFVRIKIPGVAESRPSVMRGDQILCAVHGEDRWDSGFVHFVNFDEIIASFHDTAAIRDPNKRRTQGFDIQFTFGARTLTRSVHRAIDVGTHLTKKVINDMDQDCTFWKVGTIANSPRITTRPLNEEQARFVNNVCSRAALHIIDGPPGTGKTTTVVAAVLAVYELARQSRVRTKILITCPTNAAADLIVERIDDVIKKWEDGARPSMQRVHALNRLPEHVSHQVQKYSVIGGSCFEFPDKATIKGLNIVVCTLASAGRMYSRGVEQNHFTHVFVDEAGQVTEEEMMLATTFLPDPHDLAEGERATSLILAGDHRQLGPIVHAGLCREAGMGVSALERLRHADVTPPENVVQLKRNYRSHPAIVDIVNVTYDDLLVPSREYPAANGRFSVAPGAALDESLRLLPQYSASIRSKIHDVAVIQSLGNSFAKSPVLFLHNEGKESRDEESPSWQNVSERFIVVDLVRVLINQCGKRCKDITILTPYIAQRKKIDSTINYHCFDDRDAATRINISQEEGRDNTLVSATGKRRTKCPIQVCTVEAFQGKENKIIIVSCVRSQETKNIGNDVKHCLGFMSQHQRTNVAVSRAQDAMIIIGNAGIFLRDPTRVNGADSNGSSYDRNNRTTSGLWDGYLQRISDFHETTIPTVAPANRTRNTNNNNGNDYQSPVVFVPGKVVSNFVNLANPNQTLDDLRVSLGRLAFTKRGAANAALNDDGDDESEGSTIDDSDDVPPICQEE